MGRLVWPLPGRDRVHRPRISVPEPLLPVLQRPIPRRAPHHREFDTLLAAQVVAETGASSPTATDTHGRLPGRGSPAPVDLAGLHAKDDQSTTCEPASGDASPICSVAAIGVRSRDAQVGRSARAPPVTRRQRSDRAPRLQHRRAADRTTELGTASARMPRWGSCLPSGPARPWPVR